MTPTSLRRTLPAAIFFFFAGLLLIGCGKPAAAPVPKTPDHASVAAATNTIAAAPGPGEKICFECNGEGEFKCRVKGCNFGRVICPGPCMQLSRGTWIHMSIPGHGANELWQKFYFHDGSKHFQAVNDKHVGEVMIYENGVPTRLEFCPTCGGGGHIDCKVCKGTGREVCELCQGKKFIPIAWTPTDNPVFNRQPDIIRLADGQVMLGRIAASSGEERTIVTRDKKILHVKAADILPNPPTAPRDPSL
jgi:hypothetical protein